MIGYTLSALLFCIAGLICTFKDYSLGMIFVAVGMMFLALDVAVRKKKNNSIER